MMVPVALVFIFILLYLNFRDARPVFLILANIPLALVGGVFGLKLFGMYLSVSASVGFIALFGIAILNGLVMVEFFRTLESEEEMGRREAVMEGAEMRLRPVLMTAATTALGLLPMVWASGVGSEVQRPLAVVVVFFAAGLARMLSTLTVNSSTCLVRASISPLVGTPTR